MTKTNRKGKQRKCKHELGLYGICKKCNAWPPALRVTGEGKVPRENVGLARRIARDSMNEEMFGTEAMDRFERIYVALSKPSDPSFKSKLRWIEEGIDAIREGIGFTKAMIRHNPYKEDKKGLRDQLAALKEDLKQAQAELKEKLGKEAV